MSPIRTLTVLVCCVALAGCGAAQEKKETNMTPAEALQQLHKVATAALDAASPEGRSKLDEPGPNEPCGGLGGNEDTKIKAGVTGRSGQPATEPKAAVDAARGKLEELGYKPGEPFDLGGARQFQFTGPAGGGTFKIGTDGLAEISAETYCLDNPDK